MNKPFVAVLRGGFTGEAAISMLSASTMQAAIDEHRFDAVFVTVNRDAWTCERPDGTNLPLDRSTFSADRGHGMECFSAALIAIHGSPGEDGRIQGYLDLLGIPYQTGGIRCMALTMSKYHTTTVLQRAGINVARSLLLHVDRPMDHAHIIRHVGLPCFVKPNSSGSSLGISRVEREEELGPALQLAFAEEPHVICESLARGREFTCGVMHYKGHVMALPICEIRTDRPFFDFEAKYRSDSTQEIIPADIPEHIADRIKRISMEIYTVLDCRGLVRIDHFWDPTRSLPEDIVTIEVNTIPGFSPASIFPKMLKAADIPVTHVINGLLADLIPS